VARDWSRAEVEATVTDYFSMLEKELRGLAYSKTEHRRALRSLLQDRSDGSIERKHQNISAILIELGYPWVFGYKPLGNYQGLLAEAVAARVAVDHQFNQVVQAAVEEPATLPSVTGLLERLEDAPNGRDFTYRPLKEVPTVNTPRPRVNYLEREARNASLGLAGETFVLAFERARLHQLGKASLADRVEHVSVIQGDGSGFDIRSFEVNGADRLIEVKTTAYGKQTPFFLSRNEVEVSRAGADQYHLYRVFRFREDPRLFTVQGALERVCRLDAVQFRAQIA
jgi:hypothetical protein